jgi:hypothetical protein
MESPTITPSINVEGVCHSFVINGTIQFLLGSGSSVLLVMAAEGSRTILFPGCIKLRTERVVGAGRTLPVHTSAV